LKSGQVDTELAQVETGAEGVPRARQDDRSDVLVTAKAVERVTDGIPDLRSRGRSSAADG
jgi:hypothetical protein